MADLRKFKEGGIVRPAQPGVWIQTETFRGVPWAKRRHEDGVSCLTPAACRYDANGRGRWCIDCGAVLGEDERAWHPDGAEPPEWFFGLAIVAMGLVMLLLALLAFGVSMTSPPPAPGHTPTTYGPPPTDRIG